MSTALFFGIGGGNDAVSCVLAARTMLRHGRVWDDYVFASVASPFHTYDIDESFRVAPRVFLVPPSHVYRSPHGRPDIMLPWSGAAASELIETLGGPFLYDYRFGRYSKHMSRHVAIELDGGSAGVAAALASLKELYAIDDVIAVDVGGDVLCPNPRDQKLLLSPMFDAISIAGVAMFDPNATFVEMGPGTDGEMGQRYVQSLVDGFEKLEIHHDDVDALSKLFWSSWLGKTRPGNTIPMLCESFLTGRSQRTFHAKAHVCGDEAVISWHGDRVTRFVERDANAYLSTASVVSRMNPLAMGHNQQWNRRGDSILGWIANAADMTDIMPCFEGNTEAFYERGELIATAIVPEMLRHCAARIVTMACKNANRIGVKYMLVNSEDAELAGDVGAGWVHQQYGFSDQLSLLRKL